MNARPGLVAAALAVLALTAHADASLVYFNDGTVNDFDNTWGDVGFDVPFNEPFLPGGFMDGTSDDIPPYNTNVNRGIVFRQGAAGGVRGGGVQKSVIPGQGAARRGAAIITYGSLGKRKTVPQSAWEAKFAKLARNLGGGITPDQARDMWRDGIMENGRTYKLVNYIGDPLVSVPPDDVDPGDLDPLNLPNIASALADPNTVVIFYEVTGDRPLGMLDIMVGDYDMNPGYLDVQHHLPYIALLGDVGPADFGINPQDAFMVELNGDALGGSGAFGGGILVGMGDVPAPGTLAPLAVSLMCVARRRNR